MPNLKHITLGPRHVSTGKTTHMIGSKVVGTPASLAIRRDDADSGYYLIGLDASGGELTDTYHETLGAAMAQAEFEFNVKPGEWRDCTTG